MNDVSPLPIFSFSQFQFKGKNFLGVTDLWGTLLIVLQIPYLIGLDKRSTHSWGKVLCFTEKLVINRMFVLKILMVNIFTEYAKFHLECPVKCVIGIENLSWECLTGSILYFARYSLPTSCKHKSRKMPAWLSRLSSWSNLFQGCNCLVLDFFLVLVNLGLALLWTTQS